MGLWMVLILKKEQISRAKVSIKKNMINLNNEEPQLVTARCSSIRANILWMFDAITQNRLNNNNNHNYKENIHSINSTNRGQSFTMWRAGCLISPLLWSHLWEIYDIWSLLKIWNFLITNIFFRCGMMMYLIRCGIVCRFNSGTMLPVSGKALLARGVLFFVWPRKVRIVWLDDFSLDYESCGSIE